MNEDESLCRVETKNGDFYLLSRWLGGDELTEFDITITDGSLMWKANGGFNIYIANSRRLFC